MQAKVVDNRIISVYEDYKSNLLWFSCSGRIENSSGEDLGLSAELVGLITRLAEENDARYDSFEPQVVDPMPESYRRRVWNAAQRVKSELGPGWTVMALGLEDGILTEVDDL